MVNKRIIVIFHEDERGCARSWTDRGGLVRCGECKWYAPLDRKRPFFCPVMDCATGVMEDDFCSRGERRAKMEVQDD